MLGLVLPAFAKPVVLVSYYDTFGKASFNNSQKVAGLVAGALSQEAFEVKLCALQTVYDRAYDQVEDCLKELKAPPVLYLGLGEFGCQMKIETMVRNFDKSFAPDNAGQDRNGPVIPEAQKAMPLNLPAAEMYCSLGAKTRNDVVVSNDAGSFVCNSTAFRFNYHYPEIPAGFIHVPANNCRNLPVLTAQAVSNLTSMIRAAVSTLVARDGQAISLPMTKAELQPLRNNKADACRSEYFKRSKGVDESRWGIF